MSVSPVTAYVVTCGVTPYLRRTLEGIAAQSLLPERVVIVDIWAEGRDLGTGEDLQSLLNDVHLDEACPVRIVKVPEAVNFGDAIRRGMILALEAEARSDLLRQTRTGEIPVIHPDTGPGWLWLLHDDSAPQPAALAELLRVASTGPSIGIAGAKQLDWSRPDHLLEVGINVTRSARRFNPIDEDEIDQGQHDSVDDVLAVGMAGALVRRDVWDKLDGPDPALGPFGDGLEFCRRARLAGYRVVVAPGAAVLHARASYQGLRSYGHGPQKTTTPDIARSYGARRRAQLYNWLLAVPRWQVPLLVMWLLVLTPARAIARFTMKDLSRARQELTAGFAVLSRSDLWTAGRRRIKDTQVVPSSRLAELETPPREIAEKKREHRRAEAEARSLAEAPSELELAERAQLATRRRATGLSILTLVVLLTAVGLGRFLGQGSLAGGATLPSSARLPDIAGLVTTGWIPVGDGHPGPSDALATVALLPLASGLSLGTLMTVGLLLAVPLAALFAWFGLGTVTRSIGLRVWGTVLWALAPNLLIAVLQGRLAPALVHVLLPALLYLLTRATGTARRDLILSGLVGARRVAHPSGPVEDPDDERDTGADAAVEVQAVHATEDVESAGPGDSAEAVDATDGEATEPTDADVLEPTEAELEAAGESAELDSADGSAPAEDSPTEEDEEVTIEPIPADPVATHHPSLGAGAASSLLLAAVCAASPILLPAALLLWLVLLASPARRTTWFLPLPTLALFAPTFLEVLRSGDWEALFAAPGAPLAYEPVAPWASLLGLPAQIGETMFTDAWWIAGMAASGFVVLMAVLALLRGTFRGWGVRAGWLTAVVGLVLAFVAPHVAVALDADGTFVRAWPGAGVSLAFLGFLVAAATGSDGVPRLLSRHQFGWRHLVAGALTLAAAASVVAAAASWTVLARSEQPGLNLLTAASSRPTPALSADVASGAEAARTLALLPASSGGVTAELWRADGPQIHLGGTFLEAREIADPLAFTAVESSDAASADLATLAAEISSGVARDAGARLAEHGVAVILVPPTDDADASLRRADLAAALDQTPGLVAVTENESGMIWRVSTDGRPGSAPSIHRATVRSATGEWLADLPSTTFDVSGEIPAGEHNRLLVLAERTDPGWHLQVDGQSAPRAESGWHQAFVLPATAGEVSLGYNAPWLGWILAGQAVVFAALALLALPVRRRKETV